MAISISGSTVVMAAGLAMSLMAPTSGALGQGDPTKLQISPQGGGHCVEVAEGGVAPERGLRMAECRSSAIQAFVYDSSGMHLTIGGLCVDANGGKPGDLVKLSPCVAGNSQIWRSEPQGNFTKLVGENGLCLDVRYGSKEIGAPVQTWNCGESEPNQLWLLLRE